MKTAVRVSYQKQITDMACEIIVSDVSVLNCKRLMLLMLEYLEDEPSTFQTGAVRQIYRQLLEETLRFDDEE